MTRILSMCFLVWCAAVALGGEVRPAPGMDGQVAVDEVDGVGLALFVPASATPVRGIIALPADPEVGTGSTSRNRSAWAFDEVARQLGYARLGANLKNNQRGGRGTIIRKAMEAGLERMAQALGRPELATAPVLFAGISRGGGWSVEGGRGMGQRTIAIINVCGGVGEHERGEGSVPLLALLNGIPDGFRFEERIPTQYDPARRAGAAWTLARQWGVGHDWKNADALVLPYLISIARRRLPVGATIPVALAATGGWLGERAGWDGPAPTITEQSGDAGRVGDAIWLPDRATAYAWRSFMATGAPVAIDGWVGTAPIPARDRRLVVATIGSVVRLGATVAASVTPRRLTWFANDQEIAAASAPPWRAAWSLPDGAFAVHLRCESADGTVTWSSPATLVGAAPRSSP